MGWGSDYSMGVGGGKGGGALFSDVDGVHQAERGDTVVQHCSQYADLPAPAVPCTAPQHLNVAAFPMTQP